jgi:hypothetical protein
VAFVVHYHLQVPNIDFDNADEFRRYIPGCPNVNFAWRAYGQLEVVTGGSYNLCITSDDGSMLFIDLTPGDKVLCISNWSFLYPPQEVHICYKPLNHRLFQ